MAGPSVRGGWRTPGGIWAVKEARPVPGLTRGAVLQTLGKAESQAALPSVGQEEWLLWKPALTLDLWSVQRPGGVLNTDG